MNLRRLLDIDLINELTQRGYVVRRHHAPRELKVEFGDPPPDGWQQFALEDIRGRLGFEHVDFEKVITGAGLEINRAAVRIL
jgi:hypothetical protein